METKTEPLAEVRDGSIGMRAYPSKFSSEPFVSIRSGVLPRGKTDWVNTSILMNMKKWNVFVRLVNEMDIKIKSL